MHGYLQGPVRSQRDVVLGEGSVADVGDAMTIAETEDRVGAIAPAVRGFFFPIEKPAPLPPAVAPISPADAPRELEEANPPQR